MDNAIYATLTRQTGLLAEMQAVANNIANAATTGYRGEGVVFTEYIRNLGGSAPSLSMAAAQVRQTSTDQGVLTATGGPFDMAIEGPGFFMVESPDGLRLTRSGSFTPNANGDLVTPEGYLLLDAGGAPVFVPPDAGQVAISDDGTISVGGNPIGQVGLFLPEDPAALLREDGVRFRTDGAVKAAPDARMRQGFLEESNVDAVMQVARMVEVQRAYELGQSFMEREDERLRALIRAINT